MINMEILKSVGLSDNEAEVYLILLNLGEATVYQIADQSKIARPNIYDTVKKLVEKTLATAIIKNKKKHFKPLAPEKLLGIIKEKEKNLAEILPELTKVYESKKTKPVIEVFEGAEGLKTIMDDMVGVGKDIWIFSGADINYVLKQIPEFYVKRILGEKKKYGIRTRILYSKGVKPFKGPGYELKQLPEQEISCASYWVYGDRVAIAIWANQPIIIRIISEDVAKTYLGSIKLLWNTIK